MRPSTIHHRFKIQEAVDLMARDQRNHRFKVGVTWRTIGETDKLAAAEMVLKAHRIDTPAKTFRIAEQTHPGDVPKGVL